MNAPATSLGRVLENIDMFPWDRALYLPQGEPWSLDTRCMILDPDDADDEEDAPPAALAEGFDYALDIQSVRGVVDNARQQRPNATATELLEAFLYYYDHDAFLQFK